MKKTEEVPLAQSSVVQDLKTSDYYELVNWCRRLGLDETGSLNELRTRIADKLGIRLDTAKSDSEGQTLTVDAAQNAGYMDVDAPGGGKYLRLSGGIQVTLLDRKKNVSHIIKADELWYDQEQEEMTARGNLVYTLVKGNSKEVFTGESLTFRLNDSQGVFYGGRSSRDRKIQDQTLTFKYQGEVIKRSGDDVVILENGTITSSHEPDPNYRIRAKKIWVLAPGEWGIQDAVLNIGRIPVFYFPFYFQPGDDFFFNPVLGFPGTGDTRGTYLQTTTYFIGKKKKDDSQLSFMQISDDTGDDDRVIRGLFLVKGKPEKNFPQDWSMKLMADFYSNLGFLTGLKGSFTNLGPFTKLDGLLGVGFTRTVNSDGTTFNYNPFNPLLNPWQQSNWNSSTLGSLKVPFRWGGLWNSTGKDWEVDWEYYTDPFFSGDLTANRSENFSLFTLMGLTTSVTNFNTVVKSSLQWLVRFQNIGLPTWEPYLKSFKIQNVELAAQWAVATNSSVTGSTDPARQFYYPQFFSLPKMSLNLSGNLLDTSYQPLAVPQGKKGTNASSSLPSMEPPDWALEEPKEKGSGSLDQTARSPDFSLASRYEMIPGNLQPSTATPTPIYGSTGGFSWSFVPNYQTSTYMDSSKWPSPDQGTWSVLYSRWTEDHTFTLSFKQSADNNLWAVSQDFSLKQTAQNTWYIDPAVTHSTVVSTYYVADASATNSLFTQTFTNTWHPLYFSDPFKDSSLKYSLSSRLWKNIYDHWDSNTDRAVYKDYWWDGTADSVPMHQLDAAFVWTLRPSEPQVQTTSAWTNTFTPRPTDYLASQSFLLQNSWFNFTSSTGAEYNGDFWVPSLWKNEAKWTPTDWFLWRELWYYDYQHWHPDTWTSQIKIGGFNAQLDYAMVLPYYFDQTNRIWVQGKADGSIPVGQTDFLPSQLSFSYDQDVGPLNFWLDRMEFKTQLNSSWIINLQRYTTMPLTVGYTISSKIYKFVEFKLTHKFHNESMYRYFPGILKNLGPGVSYINPLTDLAQSLAFWDPSALKQSKFKMSSLDLSAVHYLDDWVLSLTYSGSPQLVTTGGVQQYQWQGTLTLLIQWYPISEIKTNFQVDKQGTLTVVK